MDVAKDGEGVSWMEYITTEDIQQMMEEKKITDRNN